MPSRVKKHGKIRWMGRVQKDGRIRQKLFATKIQALTWEAEQRKANWSEIPTEYSLGEWAQKYLDFARKFSQPTYQEKVKAFREFFAAKDRKGAHIVKPTDQVATLRPGKVLEVLQVQFQNRSGYAANKDRKNLVAAWNWGMKYLGLPAPNPCLVDKFPVKHKPRYVPPEEDFWAIYDIAVGQDKLMLLAFLHLGARRGEIFRLTWADIDFSRQRVRLATRKRQGGSLEYDWLPMTSELKKALMDWWEKRTFKRHTHVFVCEDERACCSEYYGQPFKYRLEFMRRLCKRAGVVPFGFHAIRHLTASILYQQGHSVSVIQLILRHKSPSTTEKYLRSLGLEEARAALETLSTRRVGKVLEMKKPPSEGSSGG